MELAPLSAVLTAVHVRRIASDPRARVNDRGAVGIRPEPAAATLRRCGEQSRRAAGARADVAVAEIVGGGVIGDYVS